VKDFNMSIIFITHDLGVVAQTADKVSVMYLGRIIEEGSVRDVINSPKHPYTKGMLAALPRLDDLDSPLKPIPGDIPSPLERPSGCVFNTRCGEVLGDQCSADIPSFTSFGKSRRVACHLYKDGSGA
jgi:peptide/nickel transport system ATP-binding protein